VDESLGTKQRLFVAAPLPNGLVDFVRSAQGSLPRVPGLRLLTPEQLHVTLAFIGEVGQDKAVAARAVVEAVPPDMGGAALLGGFVLLPTARKARVITLGIEDSADVFGALYRRVMEGLETAGVMRREKRPFRAHLSVARLRVPGPVQPMSESGQARFAVESVCLYRSELKREGATYTVQACTALGGVDARDKA
jgi:2'-5' RNA ligase